MKKRKLFVFALCAALVTPSFADNPKVESDGWDVMLEMPVRLASFGLMVGGFGLFAAISPVTGLMTIPPPHDAFPRLWDTLVCKQAKYTFRRPIGDYNYNEGCARKVQPVAYQPVSPVVESPKPVFIKQPVQHSDDINKKLDVIFKKRMMK